MVPTLHLANEFAWSHAGMQAIRLTKHNLKTYGLSVAALGACVSDEVSAYGSELVFTSD